MNAVSGSVRRITISAVFLSLSLVLKTTLTFDLPLFGQNGMRIGISGIFSILPALLFGPGYGAAVSGLSDFLGFLIKPTGGYLPLLTISAAAGGFLRGFLWEILKKKEDKRMRLLIAAGSGVLLVLGLGGHDSDCGRCGGRCASGNAPARGGFYPVEENPSRRRKKEASPASYRYDCLRSCGYHS